MLEDDFNDCLSKAMRGHHCSLSQLATLAGISEDRISACLGGEEDAAVIRSIAPHLQLDAERLIALKDYRSSIQPILGLRRVVSKFGHLGVNAFIAHFGDTVLVFDTGTDSTEIHEVAPHPEQLFITHHHPDHVAGLDEFEHTKISLPEELQHGDHFGWGPLKINVLDVSGHASPAKAYFITGLEKPICIVGDAIFAGSIGGCQSPDNYNAALANIRDHLLTLPDETILCPGHGALTTVAQEKEHNPFFAV